MRDEEEDFDLSKDIVKKGPQAAHQKMVNDNSRLKY
jgi:hypothetical protein